ncbi:MAG: rhamnan synthesis F family protein [Candidatus Caldarchaeum sp.]
MTDLRDYLIIKAFRALDEHFYLKSYPDCRRADIDPVWHYVRWGWREGRDPSSDFSTSYYLSRYPDVARARINPLVHYLRWGKREGRSAKPGARISVVSPISNSMSEVIRRQVYQLAYRLYFRLPPRWRQVLLNLVARKASWLLGWLIHRQLASQSLLTASSTYSADVVMLDASALREQADPRVGEVAVHIHLFYKDLAEEFASYLSRLDFKIDIYITTNDTKDAARLHNLFSKLSCCNRLQIIQVDNRGRDIYPFIYFLEKYSSSYKYISHIHTKKSIYNKGATDLWRSYLLEQLFGEARKVRQILWLLAHGYGMIYPQTHWQLPYWAHTWLGNLGIAQTLKERMLLPNLPRGYFDYPVGSMFWARTEALQPLLRAKLTIEDFPEEAGQTDGTLAHTIERLFSLCARTSKFSVGIIADPHMKSWSRWRLDQYVNRDPKGILSMFEEKRFKIILFDVFDTLLQRPLLNPDTVRHFIKEAIANEIDPNLAEKFAELRTVAEVQARTQKGKDVSLREIYGVLARLMGIDNQIAERIMEIEINIECAAVRAHPVGHELFEAAQRTGKPILLVSDMFLPSETISTMLSQQGLKGWQSIWVSSEVGLRKDESQMYLAIAQATRVPLENMLVVGDNERADVQVPCDLQMGYIHIMRPTELARGMPKWEAIVEEIERSDPSSEITLGLILNRLFSTIHFEASLPEDLLGGNPYNVGFGFVGPMLTSFAEWLLEQSKLLGIQDLFFLSREGKIIRDVFDVWASKTRASQDIPRSHYLVVSRRCASVASIDAFSDIAEIAKPELFPTTLENFLETRYGLILSSEQWEGVEKSTGFSRETIVEHEIGQIHKLMPILKHVEPYVYEVRDQEREGLLCYLQQMGLHSQSALVDVGYAGTVQCALSKLLGFPLHGLYMMTDFRAEQREKQGCKMKGFFCERAMRLPNAHILYKYSFEVEKLLAANEPQVLCYLRRSPNSSEVVARYQHESIASQIYTPLREEIRRGALDFAKEASEVRNKLYGRFVPSRVVVERIAAVFLEKTSRSEKALLSNLRLDDLYCGRGIVG